MVKRKKLRKEAL